ncbi:hypothetical protein BJA01nite_19950 [Bradyrhizobium japonicum]|nr:hypothetical protein BJA01nite_19950 [Bradyrhizobium japonicum]
MDRHGGRPEDDHEIHGDFIESGHCQDRRNLGLKPKEICSPDDHHVMVSQWLIRLKTPAKTSI